MKTIRSLVPRVSVISAVVATAASSPRPISGTRGRGARELQWVCASGHL